MTGDVICVDKSTYDSLQQQLQQLQQSLQFLQLVIDSIPQLIFWKDTNLVYLGCNSQFARAVGANCTSEIIGKTDEELPVTDELLDLYQKCDRAVLESGEPQLRVVETFQTSDGKQVWTQTNKIPLQNAEGKIVGVLGTVEYITEQKQQQQALQESERRLQSAIAAAPIIVCVLDNKGRFLLSEGKGLASLGLKPGEIVGLSVYDLYRDVPEILFMVERALAGEVTSSCVEVGGIVFESRYNPIRNDKGEITGLIGVSVDITERQRTEEALRRSNALLQAQQEAAIDGILIINENRQVASYNQRFVELWQIPPGIIQTGDDKKLLQWVFEQLEDPEEFLAKVEYLYEHPEETSHEEIALKGGRVFERYCAAVRSPLGNYFGRIWYFRDISDRKQAEIKLQQQAEDLENALRKLQQTQAQLLQSEKMSSLGQMVAGIAHEINNPINFIHGNLVPAAEYIQDLLRLVELYQQNYPHPVPVIQEEILAIDLDFLKSDLVKLLQSMRVGTERIREIVLSLRNFSRLDEAELKQVDVHEGLDSTLMILEHRCKAKSDRSEIKIIREYGKLPLIECYPGQLNQVFMNILTNGIDALEEKAKKGNSSLKNLEIRIRTQVIDNNWIAITIADTGSGIPQHKLAKIFDPFFTTKDVGKGTGLGLSISYQIVVERHRGKLYCHSTPGEGTEFVIEIPVFQSQLI